jgi:hypothetical protein
MVFDVILHPEKVLLNYPVEGVHPEDQLALVRSKEGVRSTIRGHFKSKHVFLVLTSDLNPLNITIPHFCVLFTLD